MEIKECHRCNGEGKIKGKMMFPGFRIMITCPECNGEGELLIMNKNTEKVLL